MRSLHAATYPSEVQHVAQPQPSGSFLTRLPYTLPRVSGTRTALFVIPVQEPLYYPDSALVLTLK